jgi:hypothetical protein
VTSSCECGNEPLGFIKGGEYLASCVVVSFSRMTVLYGVGWLVGWLVGLVWLVMCFLLLFESCFCVSDYILFLA